MQSRVKSRELKVRMNGQASEAELRVKSLESRVLELSSVDCGLLTVDP